MGQYIDLRTGALKSKGPKGRKYQDEVADAAYKYMKSLTVEQRRAKLIEVCGEEGLKDETTLFLFKLHPININT